jgi:DNA processing protein
VRIKLSLNDPKFPERLRVPGGPKSIEALGSHADRLDRVCAGVAIVGTRQPSPEAWQYAYWLAATLAKAGATIISGGAYGIDAAAHEGALSVGAPTIAFLPTSVDKLSPAGNAALFKRIAANGVLVGCLSDKDKPLFHVRNGYIAALAHDVAVVSAPLKSGARNTAEHARKLNRRLWAVPGSPWDKSMEGCALELKLGAHALLSPLPIIRALGLETKGVPIDNDVAWNKPWCDAPFDPNPPPPEVGARGPRVTERSRAASPSTGSRPGKQASTVELDNPAPEELLLIESLREGPATIDELVLRTALSVGSVRVLLLTWTVEGVVREGPPGLFRLLSS